MRAEGREGGVGGIVSRYLGRGSTDFARNKPFLFDKYELTSDPASFRRVYVLRLRFLLLVFTQASEDIDLFVCGKVLVARQYAQLRPNLFCKAFVKFV